MANKEFWSVDTLREFAAATESVEIEGKFIQVKKLPASSLDGFSKDDDNANYIMVQKGLANPELTIDQLKALPIDLFRKISDAIIKFSGIGLDKAEKD